MSQTSTSVSKFKSGQKYCLNASQSTFMIPGIGLLIPTTPFWERCKRREACGFVGSFIEKSLMI